MDEADPRRGSLLILFLDTSVLVAALTNETRTSAVQAWLAAQAAGSCATSDWIITEFSSALSIKLRTGHLTLAERANALAVFTRLAAESLSHLSINPAHFRTAARFADQHTLGIRAADALHLAVCADYGASLCTLDRRLAAAAPVLGIPTQEV